MKRYLKRGLIGFVALIVGLVILGALIGPNEDPKTPEAVVTTTAESPEVNEESEAPQVTDLDGHTCAGNETKFGRCPDNDYFGKTSAQVRAEKAAERKKARAEAAAAREAEAQAKAEAEAEAEAQARADAEARETVSQQNARRSAESYLEFSAFSRQGLIDQLSSEYGAAFPLADAVYAVDHLDVDWNEQAARAAKAYLETSAFSRQGLIDQLSSEYGGRFTYEQAVYGVDQTGL